MINQFYINGKIYKTKYFQAKPIAWLIWSLTKLARKKIFIYARSLYKVSAKLPPGQIVPRSGSGFGLGLALELGLGGNFPRSYRNK